MLKWCVWFNIAASYGTLVRFALGLSPFKKTALLICTVNYASDVTPNSCHTCIMQISHIILFFFPLTRKLATLVWKCSEKISIAKCQKCLLLQHWKPSMTNQQIPFLLMRLWASFFLVGCRLPAWCWCLLVYCRILVKSFDSC